MPEGTNRLKRYLTEFLLLQEMPSGIILTAEFYMQEVGLTKHIQVMLLLLEWTLRMPNTEMLCIVPKGKAVRSIIRIDLTAAE